MGNEEACRNLNAIKQTLGKSNPVLLPQDSMQSEHSQTIMHFPKMRAEDSPAAFRKGAEMLPLQCSSALCRAAATSFAPIMHFQAQGC